MLFINTDDFQEIMWYKLMYNNWSSVLEMYKLTKKNKSVRLKMQIKQKCISDLRKDHIIIACTKIHGVVFKQ